VCVSVGAGTQPDAVVSKYEVENKVLVVMVIEDERQEDLQPYGRGTW